MPKVNYATDDLYTTGIRSTWTGEQPVTATTHRVTEPVFGQIRIPVYTNMMSMPLTRDLIEDAAFDVQGWSADKFRETIMLLKDNMILNGTGVGQPAGILVNPGGTNQPGVVVSGAGSALTSDGLQNVAWSVPEQYEENLRWVFNKTNTGKAIANLKDGNGRYTWGSLDQSGMVLPAVNRPLFGYPVTFSGFAPNIGSNAYPAIFGDLSGYYLVNRVGFSIQVLNELYAETNQVLLLGRVRFGGAVAEDWKLKIQKVAAS
jgi:HK97 family phage major capsid protein